MRPATLGGSNSMSTMACVLGDNEDSMINIIWTDM